jgi:hypothetical protein
MAALPRRKDTLGAAAYACLSYIERVFASGEREAAAKLGVSRAVLETVRRLASTRGDEAAARKFETGPRQAHTPAEIALLEAAVTAIIRRVGEVAAVSNATSLPEIRLADLSKALIPRASRRISERSRVVWES